MEAARAKRAAVGPLAGDGETAADDDASDEVELQELDAIVKAHPSPKSAHTAKVVAEAKARAAEIRAKRRELLPAHRLLQRAEQAVQKATAANDKAKAALEEAQKAVQTAAEDRQQKAKAFELAKAERKCALKRRRPGTRSVVPRPAPARRPLSTSSSEPSWQPRLGLTSQWRCPGFVVEICEGLVS